MRAKACTRCRQWKVGCDADVAGPEGCTRCRNLHLLCTFDGNFRRTPKRKQLAELQSQVAELRELTNVLSAANGANAVSSSSAIICPSVTPPSWLNANGSGGITLSSESALQGLCIADKSIGDIHLTATHVNELFRIYFTRCHPYLPFALNRSIESIYERSPTLFWVICAVASTDTARSQFESTVRRLVADVLIPTAGNVETVQALLILCMWPFPFTSQRNDPSFIHGAIATQIALSIGLHRPSMDFDSISERSIGKEDEEIRKTTWQACFVVNQIQASRRGVPATILADYALLSSFDDAAELSHLCRISHLTVESAHAIGARGSNVTGLVGPATRISLINIFAKQFDELRRTRFPKPSDVVEMFFLSSRLQLWSFAMHDDVPVSADAVQIVHRAKEDAIRLIQVACEKNLSLVPFYTCRSVCYSVLLLYRIKIGPYAMQDDLINHHIERAQQALSSSKSPNFFQFLATVTSPENRAECVRVSRAKESSHRSRMGAFLVFDSLRVYTDLLQTNVNFPPEFLDLDGLSWTDIQ
ncbi:uncharacterized protein Z518_10253 [Rhinocladiella mackenziei CBS 650.93]|uniref:Zn(2)-C6 fungal-type domain-containing protein n=1 Tax=Rhinocladiella mackenziei CBS 650.93 TaxID=1442369 RepID=A0A0D2IA42_9EURO|nr:uncharacterized protein Z518_10253 [Rhinocladiella mackenziei CBS 650.93]KIX00116.1 hypothetical protein Z518_10253 [Rhinocladiella mackenziei CBS 650.93]